MSSTNTWSHFIYHIIPQQKISINIFTLFERMFSKRGLYKKRLPYYRAIVASKTET